jgi:hypothetical protein
MARKDIRMRFVEDECIWSLNAHPLKQINIPDKTATAHDDRSVVFDLTDD